MRRISNWEGAYRVPADPRLAWQDQGMAEVSNEIVAHYDMLPTILAAAGDPRVTDKLAAGHKIGDMTYKVHPRWIQSRPVFDRADRKGSARVVPLVSTMISNWSHCGMTTGRSCSWSSGQMDSYCSGPILFTNLRVPNIFNLRTGSLWSGRTSPPTPTTTGYSITCSCLCQHRITGQFLTTSLAITRSGQRGGQLQSGRRHGEARGGEVTRRYFTCMRLDNGASSPDRSRTWSTGRPREERNGLRSLLVHRTPNWVGRR